MTFVHIPKTAGVSISKWLLKNCDAHLLINKRFDKGKHMEFREIVNLGDPGFSFSVVRNPWDRLLSGFSYYKKRHTRSFENISFEEFVKSEKLGKLGRNQVHYLDSKRPEYHIDLILRFESLERDFIQIQNKLNCYEPLTKANRSNHEPYQNYYTNEMRDIVNRLYKTDIETFEYEF